MSKNNVLKKMKVTKAAPLCTWYIHEKKAAAAAERSGEWTNKKKSDKMLQISIQVHTNNIAK